MAQGRLAPEPDWERIIGLSTAGHLAGFTARAADRTLQGGAIFVLQPSLIYRRQRHAVLHWIYVSQAHRGRGSLFLVREAVGALRRRGSGVDEIYIPHAAGGGPLDSLLSDLGGAPLETYWRLRCDHGAEVAHA